MNKIPLIQIIGDSSLFGAPKHLLTLVSGLDRRKYEITCICPPGPLAQKLKEVNTIEVKEVSIKNKWDFKAIREIRRIINQKTKTKKALVHCHGLRGGWLGRLACIGHRKSAPKVIYTEHLWTKDYHLKSPILNFLQVLGLWFLDLFTDITIAVSRAVAQFLISRKISRPEKIKVIYNGIKLPQKVKVKNYSKKENFILGFVGSLTERKGVKDLISAISKIKGVSKLIIAGTGPEEEKLKDLTKKLNIKDKVDFRGFVKDPAEIYSHIDLYIQPSWDEAFGLSVLEALSYGVPTVASNVGGLREILGGKEDKEANKKIIKTEVGYLIPPKNSKALEDAILKAIKNKNLNKMSKQAIERAKLFSADKMIKETEKVYASLVS